MVRIELTKGYSTIVDGRDYEWATQWKWLAHVTACGIVYAERSVRHQGGHKSSKMMHRELWERHNGKIPKDLQLDHCSRDGLDNRMENLHLCSRGQNQANSPKTNPGGCLSRYKGVSREKGGLMWRAYIKVRGRQRHLGSYQDEAEAARSYDRAALAHFGEFACLNKPGSLGGE